MVDGDFYVLLGCKINDDCTISDMQRSRVDDLIKNLPDNNYYIIFSGGYTNSKCNKSEAEIMKEYAIKNGIDKYRILMETRSMNTLGNAIYTMELLYDINIKTKKLKLVTSCFHMKRACNIFTSLLKGIEIECKNCSKWNADYAGIERIKWLMDKKFIDENLDNSIDIRIKNLEKYNNLI